jgi:hypothetical protein
MYTLEYIAHTSMAYGRNTIKKLTCHPQRASALFFKQASCHPRVGGGVGLALGTGLALGAGVGVGLGAGLGVELGIGLGTGMGAGLGVGLGAGLGTGLSLGVGTAAGLSLGIGLGETVVGLGTAVGFTLVFTVEGLAVPRRVLPRAGVRGVVVTSAGVGPASAGLVTSVPVAAGTGCGARGLRRLLATVRDGVNEHVCVEPATGISVRRSPFFRARSEITCGAVADMPAVGVPVSPA